MTIHFDIFAIDRSKRWVINCRRADLMSKDVKYLNSNCRMCDMHFTETQFMNHMRDKLVWNAIPTIFDVPNPPRQLTSKRKAPTDRRPKQETQPAVMVIKFYKY